MHCTDTNWFPRCLSRNQLARELAELIGHALEKVLRTRGNNGRGRSVLHIVTMKPDCNRRTRSTCLAGLIAIGLISLETASVLAQEGSPPRAPAPDWQLTDLNGKLVKFTDFRGKVVILDFWATWCAPCRVEIPHFVELQKQYGDKGLTVIGVSLDEQGPQIVKKFAKQFGVNYAIVIGNQKVVEAYGGIAAVPITFVIDRQGRIVSRHIGYDDKAAFEEEIQSLL
jgi:thiol-disulfide isomerase/thioredoxin